MAKNTFISNPNFYKKAWGNSHPLGISRQLNLFNFLQAMHWLTADEIVECHLPTKVEIGKLHCSKYIDEFETAAISKIVSESTRMRYNFGNFENPIFDGVFNRARATIGGAKLGASIALKENNVFHFGGGTHHGKRAMASGFCFFNDPAFAIKEFLDAGIEKIAYIDLDAHHGDGVEQFYENENKVFLISIHEENRWPNSGDLKGNVRKNILNLPVPEYINDSEFSCLVEKIDNLLNILKPQAIVMVAGADCLIGDPLSKMEVSNICFVRAINKLIKRCSRNLILGGGGYNPWTVTRAWALLWGYICNKDFNCEITNEAAKILKTMSCDLIDDEDINPLWLSTIIDKPNEGDIRPQIIELTAEIEKKCNLSPWQT